MATDLYLCTDTGIFRSHYREGALLTSRLKGLFIVRAFHADKASPARLHFPITGRVKIAFAPCQTTIMPCGLRSFHASSCMKAVARHGCCYRLIRRGINKTKLKGRIGGGGMGIRAGKRGHCKEMVPTSSDKILGVVLSRISRSMRSMTKLDQDFDLWIWISIWQPALADKGQDFPQDNSKPTHTKPASFGTRLPIVKFASCSARHHWTGFGVADTSLRGGSHGKEKESAPPPTAATDNNLTCSSRRRTMPDRCLNRGSITTNQQTTDDNSPPLPLLTPFEGQ
ncbi:hypothetical protein L249_7003 [Ophiocordyceps polyrhachis-furcata BCC 54312]|uniref:Uncharacterized protein n=1 Tax=Ophiocordyceps polyrhachis-furcata BCC 54312 TaxID=1330021 RepID=A0A367LLK3_9HYPO|nr:hypothetical protein L249_7003 [Ophiocordyceps polyrhachis-furcata BCC 54312]